MRRRAFGLRLVSISPSRPFGFNPSRLRAGGAARFACPKRLQLRRLDTAFGFGHQHSGTASQRLGDLEDDRQCRHVFAALDLTHVGTLDAGQVRQRLLGNAAFRAQCTHRRAEGLGQLGVEGGGAGGSAALDGSFLHRQKRRLAAQLKPRYL